MTEPPDDTGSTYPNLHSASNLELVLPPPTPVSGDSTAGVVVRSHLRKQTAALLAANVGLDDDLPDAVHASRVAARRLRSGLRVYGDLLTDDLSVRLRPELSWYAGLLSPVRDLEVFTERLARDTEDANGYGDVLLPWLRHRHAVALASALPELRSSRADALRVALARLATDPRFTHEAAKRAVKVLGPRVLRADDRAAKLLGQLRPGDASASWHSARISAKRARYAAEVGAPALGRPCQDLASMWSELTEPLGDGQDAAIQRALVLDRVDDTSSPISAGEAFVCGVYVAATHDREVESHRAARGVWRESRSRHRALRQALGA
jgi:CHAD domain-containing protein